MKWGVRYQTFVINSPVYCAYMLRKFILKGGQKREYTLADLKEAFHLADNVRTVVNCSGTGMGDPKSFIIRGLFALSLSLFPLSILKSSILIIPSRPNLSRPKPLQCNPHQTKLRRHLVLLHPPSPRRRNDNRRHQRTPQLGSQPVSRNKGPASRKRSQMVPLHGGEWWSV